MTNFKRSFNKLCNKAERFIKDNAPTILSMLGVGGVGLTSVLTARSTIKANNKLDEIDDGTHDTNTAIEIISYYIPPVLSGIGTVLCILGANALNKQHQAMLTSAYAMISQSYDTYRNKNIEENGEEADRKIKTALVQDDEQFQELLLEEPDDKVIYYDGISEESVVCYEKDILHAEYDLNRLFAEDGHAMLNNFWELLGIKPNNYGAEFGWSKCSGLNWIDFSHTPIEEDDGGTPIYMVEYPVPEKLEWWEM